MPATPVAPGGLKLSKEGNWKGSETGTRPPNMPKPRGRVEGLPRRAEPAVTCERRDVVEEEANVPEAAQPFPAFEPGLAPPITLCLCPLLAETEGEEDGVVLTE